MIIYLFLSFLLFLTLTLSVPSNLIPVLPLRTHLYELATKTITMLIFLKSANEVCRLYYECEPVGELLQLLSYDFACSFMLEDNVACK